MTALLRTPELEKYELLEEIGHGGMATVYRARDRRLGREVAVKIIHRHLRDSEEASARFMREARAIAKLRHPNIVEVYDISDEGESERYLVVELVRGTTLRQILKRHGRLEPELAAAITLQIAAGLEHAHRHGVVHRDVKPENVLIELQSADRPEASGSSVKVKLTDFGIAKLLDAQGVTSTGQVLGSPAHMAPEQIEGGDVDARTDVFALGVLLYECMVGKLPFEGAHPAQVLRKVLDGDFVPADLSEPRVGASYARVVSRALCRDPMQRFGSVQELVDALNGELARLGFTRTDTLLGWVVPCAEYAGFSQRIVPELVAVGLRARADRQMSRAAEDFNRALAYRPGDPELLRHVSGLRRLHQLRRLVAGALVVGASTLLIVAFGSAWLEAASGARESERAREDAVAATPSAVPPVASAPLSTVSGAPSDPGSMAQPSPEPSPTQERTGAAASPAGGDEPRTEADVVNGAAERARSPARRVPQATPPPPAEREVIVRITGAMGGTLRIDGEPRDWFGDVRHELTLGPHRFEFVPPDDTCCEATARTVVIAEGEGPQQVVGDIPFREATLRVSVSGGESGTMSCPTLFSGEQRFPGERRIAMSRVRVSGTCILRADEPEGGPAIEKQVTLRAGQTYVIPWP